MQDIGTDQNTQNETAVIAFGQNVIAVYKSSNKNVAGFGPPDFSCPDGPWYPPIVPQGDGWAVSHDGGVTFTDKGTFPVLSNVVVFVQTADNGSSGYFVTTNMGDIADPALARDNTSGAIYFAALTQRSSVYYPNGTNQPGRIYAPVWRSINNGDTVQAPVNASAGLTNQAWNDITDGPVVVVDNFPGTGQGDVYLSFAWLHPQSDIILCRSTNGGLDWQIIQQITNVCRGNVFMTTNHEVCVGWQPVQDCAHGQQAYTNTLYIDRSTNRGLSFYTTNVTHLVSNGGTNKFTRSVTAPSDDQFFGGVGSFALNPANGNFYYAYYDQPPSGTNRPNIYLRQLTNGVDWTDPIQVNVEPGGVATDQWQPTITVKPDGTKLFVAWYDRRDDPTNHYLIRMYGGFAALPITGSNAFATNFAISTASFPPVFAGTTMTGTNQFDPVYPPFPRNDGTYCPNFGGIFSPYTMGDYNRAFSENSYVHFTWGDNRNNYTATNGFTRNQADVRFIRLSWPR